MNLVNTSCRLRQILPEVGCTLPFPVTTPRDELVLHCLSLLHGSGLASQAGAESVPLSRFVEQASRTYRKNPYHNWCHAVSVVHCAVWLLTRPKFAQGIPAVDRFWLLIAAISHDLDHPGHNNQLEVSTESPLARRFGGISVLERHSLDIAREILARPECDFSSSMPEEDQVRGHVLLSELIRATDFAAHQEFLAEFSGMVSACDGQVNLGDPAMRILVMKALIKAADISNVAEPFPEAQEWAMRVMAEMWSQGRKEKALGLPLGPLNDPERTTLEQAQIGFIRSNVLGLLGPLARIEPDLEQMLASVRRNLARYQGAAAL